MTRGNAKIRRSAESVPGSEDQVVNHRLLRRIDGMLRQLTEQPEHGNRRLHDHHVVVAHLVAFLNPALNSLRRIEDVYEHSKVRRIFGSPRVPKSTLADAQAVFDPALLMPLIDDLRRRVGLATHDQRLDELTKHLIAVDGTFFTVAARVAWAVYNKPNRKHKPRKGNVRVDLHFNVLTGVPEQAILTDGRTPEYETLSQNCEPNRFYVLDRAYHCYQMMADILTAGSDFLVRLRKDMKFNVLEEHPLGAADKLAGVRYCRTVGALGRTRQKSPEIRAFSAGRDRRR